MQPYDRSSLRVKRAVQKVFVLPLTTYSVNRWFLGALSGDSDQHDKWKVQLTVSVNQIQVQSTAISKSTFDSLLNQARLTPTKIAHLN